jgi:hypothetical protein
VKRFRKFIGSEEGSVETGLVMIPVMILFLSVLQLPTSALARIAYSAKLQSDTYLQSFVATPQGFIPGVNQSQSPNQLAESSEFLPLPGGGELVVKNRKIGAPAISPLLIGGDQFNSIGISVNENN